MVTQNRFARKDLFKAFDETKSSHKSDFFFSEKIFFPSCVRNML